MSKIEWTDRSDWNPIRGCTRVSPGCGGPGPHGGCYAERIAARFSDPGQPFHGFARRTPSGGRWTGRVELLPDRLCLPLRWRKPARIFVNSTSDLFHEDLPDAAIDKVFAVMALAPQHTFQVLTKRAERMRAYFSRPGYAVEQGFTRAMRRDFMVSLAADRVLPNWQTSRSDCVGFSWPLPNVWLGVSVEDQARADERIPALLATPAAVRFLSCEPLLGPVDLISAGWLTQFLPEAIDAPPPPRIDWVIAGGESGPGARPMAPAWARSLRDQCAAAGVAFHFKQWGEWAPSDERAAGHMERVGKKRAGRLLDGVQHDGFPP